MTARLRTASCLILLVVAGVAAAWGDIDVAALIDRCGHSRMSEREAAFRTLLDEATPADVPALVAALESTRGGRVRTRCARVLGRLGAPGCPGCRAPLERVLGTDKSEHVRTAAAQGLADLGDRRAAPALVAALRDDKTTRVRRQAAVSLVRIGGSKAYATLAEVRKTEPAWEVRRALDWLLADRGRGATRVPAVKRGATVEGAYKGTRYLVHVPSSYERKTPRDLLVVIHGTDGHPEGYVDLVRALAEREGLVVLAPWFDWPTFPNFGMLNPGLDAVRADVRLLEIVETLSNRLSFRSRRLLLFGHSQGGGFVNRFAAVHPDRVRRAVASSANSFVNIESDDAFPWGVGANPFLTHLEPIDPNAFTRVPMLVVVGGAEEKRFLDRAREFVERTERVARARGVPNTVRYHEIPQGKHSGEANFAAARAFLTGAD